jgi:general secretion pathway protein K
MVFRKYRQRGVAVVTALLLTTLAVTIVASLFWQQQVQVRSIENQRLQLQKQWILRGALDWARLILRENARLSNYDSLDQPWAVPLLDTRLDQYVENNRADTESSDATLSGQMVDAQSLYNLTNLAPNGQIVEKEVKVFARLLASQRLNPSLAQDTAAIVAASVPRQPAPANGAQGSEQNIDPLTGLPRANANTNTGATGNQATAPVTVSSQRLMPMTQVEDLLAIPGFTPEAVEKLRNLVIFLPQGGTSLNINTAPVEVLAAVIENISTSDAAVIVATRTTASFRSKETIANQLPGIPTIGSNNIDVYSNYFLVNGRVKLNRAALQIQALMKRTGRGPSTKTQLVWIREN